MSGPVILQREKVRGVAMKQPTPRKRRSKPAHYIPSDLNPDQAQAVACLSAAIKRGDPVCRLLGFAGTGKSYCTVRLLRSYQHERPILLTAPTNKASAVLRSMANEIGGDVESMTTHRALGLRPEVDAERGRQVLKQVKTPEIPDGALMVVDEASMVDSLLLNILLREARQARAQLIFVGDPCQLPPIFEPESPAFSGPGVTARLTQIVRQAADHPILDMTARIRAAMGGGEVPRFATHQHEAGSLVLLDNAAFEAAMLASFQSQGYRDNPDFCRLLAWTNQRTHAYNRLIRRTLMGAMADQYSLLPGETVVACTPVLGRVNVGDFVTVQSALPVNHHGIPAYRAIIKPELGMPLEVFVVRPEGIPAYRERLSYLAKAARVLQKESQHRRLTKTEDRQRREAWVEFFSFKDSEFCDLRPIHASTTHKAQGSTYQTVYVDLSDIGRNTRRDVLLRLLYVALTRARGDVVVTGELPDRLYPTANGDSFNQ